MKHNWIFTMNDEKSPGLQPWAKMVLEAGPLLVYLLITFKVHESFDLDLGSPVYRPAVIWLVAVTPFQVAILWWAERKVPWSSLITAVFLIGFGIISLGLEDDRWIKAKPSVVYAFFVSALAVGLLAKRSLLKHFLGSQIKASDEQWRSLTINFILFFLASMILNVVIWLGFDAVFGAGSDASFQAWSLSKLFFVILSAIFSVWQFFPLVQENTLTSDTKK